MSAQTPFKNMIALGLVFTAGNSGTMTLPLWLGGIVSKFNIEVWMAGAISALYFFGVFLGSFVLSSQIHKVNKRNTAVIGLCLACSGFVTAIFATNIALVAVGLPVAGIGLGLGFASTTATISHMANSQKVFSQVHLILVLYSILFFSIVPGQMVVYGLNAILIALALTAVVAGVLAFMMFPDIKQHSPQNAVDGVAKDKSKPAMTKSAYLILVALTFFYIGQNGVWSLVERVGAANELAINEIGHVLLIGAFIAMLGPLASGWLGKRFGLTMPIIGAIATLCVVSFVFFSIQSQIVFVMGAVSVPMITLFAAPYMLEYVATIDHSGRASALAPGFIMIGCGFGPALSGAIASATGLASLGVVVCIPFVIAAAIYFSTGMRKVSALEIA